MWLVSRQAGDMGWPLLACVCGPAVSCWAEGGAAAHHALRHGRDEDDALLGRDAQPLLRLRPRVHRLEPLDELRHLVLRRNAHPVTAELDLHLEGAPDRQIHLRGGVRPQDHCSNDSRRERRVARLVRIARGMRVTYQREKW